jgi:CBS domain-containing protein
MKTVKQVLKLRGTGLISVTPGTPVLDALKLMEEQDLESLLVIEGERLVGIVTESDYARKIALQGKTPRSAMVKDIMSRQVITATPNEDMDDCIDTMIRYNLRHLPVTEGGRVIGVVSMNEAVRATLFHQKDTIRFLEDMMLMEESV